MNFNAVPDRCQKLSLYLGNPMYISDMYGRLTADVYVQVKAYN